MNEKEEKAYIEGSRSVWLNLLGECLKNLGLDEIKKLSWVVEREQAIQALRILCRDFGDNDWNEDLSLADIIDKHLAKHLE